MHVKRPQRQRKQLLNLKISTAFCRVLKVLDSLSNGKCAFNPNVCNLMPSELGMCMYRVYIKIEV